MKTNFSRPDPITSRLSWPDPKLQNSHISLLPVCLLRSLVPRLPVSYLTNKTGHSSFVPGYWSTGNPAGDFTGNNFRLHGIQISPDNDVNFRYAGKRGTRLRTYHLPYLLFLGLNHVVLTSPETQPYMIFLFVASYLCT